MRQRWATLMNSAQTDAWTAAAGASPGALSTLIALVLVAVGLLWVASVILKLGREALEDPDPRALFHYMLYKLRAIVLISLLIYLVS